MDQGNFPEDFNFTGPGNEPPPPQFIAHDPSTGRPMPPEPPMGDQYVGKVNMWQGNYSMNPESGFISGSNTHPSSMTGHEDGMEDSASFVGGGQGSISNSLYDLDSAAHSGKCLTFATVCSNDHMTSQTR